MKTREEITKEIVDNYIKNSSTIYNISLRFGN